MFAFLTSMFSTVTSFFSGATNSLWKWVAIVIAIVCIVFIGLYYFQHKEIANLNKTIEDNKITIGTLKITIKDRESDIASLNATLAGEYKINDAAQKREQKLLNISSNFHSIPLGSYSVHANNSTSTNSSNYVDNGMITIEDSKAFLHWMNTEIVNK